MSANPRVAAVLARKQRRTSFLDRQKRAKSKLRQVDMFPTPLLGTIETFSETPEQLAAASAVLPGGYAPMPEPPQIAVPPGYRVKVTHVDKYDRERMANAVERRKRKHSRLDTRPVTGVATRVRPLYPSDKRGTLVRYLKRADGTVIRGKKAIKLLARKKKHRKSPEPPPPSKETPAAPVPAPQKDPEPTTSLPSSPMPTPEPEPFA